MEMKTPGYRVLPYISALLLLGVTYVLTHWLDSMRDTFNVKFEPLPFAFYATVAPILFILASLLLFASVFNQRLTRLTSLIFIILGLAICLIPFVLLIVPVDMTVPFIATAYLQLVGARMTSYLQLAGAIIAVSGFAGLILQPKILKPAAIGD